jgi:hypothetical protein
MICNFIYEVLIFFFKFKNSFYKFKKKEKTRKSEYLILYVF